jgi:hypothetical protein
MLACLTRRAGAELRDLLRQHLMNKLSSLLEHFPGAEPAPAPKAAKAVGPRLQGRGSGVSKQSA